MIFGTDDTNVMVLVPQDEEAKYIKALESRLAKLFREQESYILQNTCNEVALGKTGRYKARGLKEVYKFIVDTNSKKRLTQEQVKVLKKAEEFIQRFDRSWQPPKR